MILITRQPKPAVDGAATHKLASSLLFRYYKDTLATLMHCQDQAEQILKEVALKQKQSPAFHLMPGVSLTDNSHNYLG